MKRQYVNWLKLLRTGEHIGFRLTWEWTFWLHKERATSWPVCRYSLEGKHSFRSLYSHRSIAPPEASSPKGEPSAPSFSFQYLIFSIMQSSSFLRLLPRLYVAYIHSFAYASSTRLRRQFLATMWLIQFNFLHFIVSKTPLSSLTLYNTSSFFIWSFRWIFFILLQRHISKLSRWAYSWYTFQSIYVAAPYKAIFQMKKFTSLFLKIKTNLLENRVLLFNVAFPG
jgi:hypothetical protein